MKPLRSTLLWLWSRRRWAYAGYMLVAVSRIPARTGFRLVAPRCDTRLTLENAALSLTKVPHVVLFGFFFLLTAAQFDRLDRRTLTWSFVATLVVGALVEVEEGATRTGNCRMTDVLPDALGALIVMAFLVAFTAIRHRLSSAPPSGVG